MRTGLCRRPSSWVTTYLCTCRTLHSTFAWQLVPAKSPVKFSSWGSYRFASFALSLSFLHYPAPLGLVHPVSHCDSRCFALVESGDELLLPLGLPGTTLGAAFLNIPVAPPVCWQLSLRAWVADRKEVTVTRKSPLPNNLTAWD